MVGPESSNRLPLVRQVASVGAAVVLLAGIIAAGQPTGDDDSALTTEPAGSDTFGATVSTLPSDLLADPAVPGEGVSDGAPTSTGGGAGRRSSAGGRRAAPGADGGGSSPVASAPASGSTEPVPIGIPWEDTAQANAALTAVSGAAGFEGSQKVQAQAVVDWINANGGLAGRPIDPIYYQIDVAQYVTKEGRTREAENMCAAWTEDHHVFAMLSGADAMPEHNISECAANARTPLVLSKPDGVHYISESRAAEIGSYYFWPNGMLAERRERVMVDGLATMDMLQPGAKVGVLLQDDPFIREGVERSLLPALRARGIEPVAMAAYPDIIESPWDTYVLQFQSAGVEEVFFAATTGSVLPSFFFMRAAENQAYRPRYGVGSDHAPGGLKTLGAPVEQMGNVRLVGGSPATDTLDVEPFGPASTLCRDIMRGVGQPDFSAGNAYCEGLFFIKAAVEAELTFTPEGFVAGVQSLGTGYDSVLTIGTRFSPGVHAGHAVVRNGRYVTECECFRYTSPPRQV